MKDLLNYLKEQHELCEIYEDDSESDHFWVGYILSYNDDFVLFHSITPNGRDDGIECRPRKAIYQIQIKTAYLKDLQKIMQENFESAIPSNFSIEGDILMGVLEWTKKEERVCLITLEQSQDEAIRGKIEEIGEEYVEIRLLDEHGNEDGICYFLYSDIRDVGVGTEELKRVELLSKK